MAKDPYKYFRVEAREIVEGLSQGFLQLERGVADVQLVRKLLRSAHTLKGASRIVKQIEIADLAHRMEDVLSPYREGTTAASREATVELFRLLDAVSARVAGLGDPAAAPTAPATPAVPMAAAPPAARPIEAAAPAPEPSRVTIADTVRIDVADIDAVLDGVAGSTAQVARLQRTANDVADLVRLAHDVGQARSIEEARRLAEELRDGLERSHGRLNDGVVELSREVREVGDHAGRLRLVSAETLFAPLGRAVRDAAQFLGREVDFEPAGGDVRLDAPLLSAIRDALLHVVRNAVAHGIEAPADRAAAGKPPRGRIVLRVERRGDRVAFVCEDDGRGIDVQAVARAARRESLTPEAAAELIFRPGVSTSDETTAISGRGVGLDVVHSLAARFRGAAHARSEPGRGTTIEILVPISLSSVAALAVAVGGSTVWIPLDAVRKTLRVGPTEIARTESGEVLLEGGNAVPFARAGSVLPGEEGSARTAAKTWTAVLVAIEEKTAALGVDRLMGVSRIVVRPLPRLAGPIRAVSGAVLDADGNPELVLDPRGLVERIHATASSATVAEVPKRLPILIIDDSLTTRMLEQSILETAGYEVTLASSAEEGLRLAHEQPFGLFLVDVEMPGMNGFEFVARTKADARLHAVPSILVTSLNSPDDHRRGVEVGAHAHIVKGEFDEQRLRKLIRELVG